MKTELAPPTRTGYHSQIISCTTNQARWPNPRVGMIAMDLTCFASEWRPAPAPVPADTTIFAIGDVHGCIAHFNAMVALMRELASVRGHGTVHLVTIGDYVDRGPDNLGVLKRLRQLTTEPWASVHTLRGNHDQFLADFLESPTYDLDDTELWRMNGGDRTMAELGISYDDLYSTPLPNLRDHASAALTPAIQALIRDLRITKRLGGWLFVHAGVDPLRPLAEHAPGEFIWMRQPFLRGIGWSHDFCVVHGHTIRGHEVLPHRVAIDSGAFFTGVLSGIEIESDRLRFLAVGPDPDLQGLSALPGHTAELRYTALTTLSAD